MHRYGGLTLIELLVTATLVTILSITCVPTFSNLILDLRMTSQVNGFVHAFHLAKQASQQLFAEVAVCKSPDGVQCDIEKTWAEGWIAFVNTNQDHPPHVNPDERILAVGSPFASGLINANRQHFVFRPFELRSTNGTLTFCDRRGASRARAVVLSYSGRPRTIPAAANRAPGEPSPVCPT